MKRTLYLMPLLLCLTLLVQAQSQINSTVQVHLGGNMGVYGNLNFNSGYVITPRASPGNNVYATAGATHTGASDASHVDGYVEEAGHTAFTFPIGNGASYRSAGIASASTANNYRAAYFSGNPGASTLPTGAPFATTSRGTGVGAVSTVEYWDIDGSASASITLSWNAASDVSTLAGGSPNRLVIVGWNGSQWVNLGQAGGISGSLVGDGSVTAANITPNAYTAYTFGSLECQLAATATTTSSTICSGGTISLSASTTGAVGTLSYKWSGPNSYSATGSAVTIPNATVLASGTYTVVVTDAGTGCSTTAVTAVSVNDCRISLRVYLQGALFSNGGTVDANGLPLMRDNLRSGGYLPLNDPYRVAPYSTAFPQVNNPQSQTIPASMTATTGDKAIVDWVFVELRNKTTPTQVSYTRSALLLRDGSVLDSDGQGGVNFSSISLDNYYVAVRHRNHMGIMTAQTVTVPSSTTVDFNTMTDAQVWNNTGYDALERSTITAASVSVRALWAGNAVNNGKIKYNGSGTDLPGILSNVVSYPGNTGAYNFSNARGYLIGDVNLDGRSLYIGSGNDGAFILSNVVNYPLNSAKTYNYDLFIQQLP